MTNDPNAWRRVYFEESTKAEERPAAITWLGHFTLAGVFGFAVFSAIAHAIMGAL